MVLSSRDRRYVVVEMVWLGPSLERRRLRFSFQFNDVKDRSWLSPAPLFSAGGRRRRLSRGPPLPCQSPVSNLCEKVPKPSPGGTAGPTRGNKRACRTFENVSVHIRVPIEGALITAAPRDWQGESGLATGMEPRRTGRKASKGQAPRRIRPGGPPRRSGRRPP